MRERWSPPDERLDAAVQVELAGLVNRPRRTKGTSRFSGAVSLILTRAIAGSMLAIAATPTFQWIR
jgi:hypothetical protein